MAWKLNGVEIPAPQKKVIKHSIQKVTHRTIDGGHSRDYVGDEKKVIVCEYEAISIGDYNLIIAKYVAQRDSGTTVTLVIDELGYSFNVIIDVEEFELDIPNHYDYRQLKVSFIQV